MTIEDIEKEVLQWHKITFPRATDKAIIAKLDEEISELVRAIITDGNTIEEIADVCIVAITLLHRLDTSLAECIKHKLAINKRRHWGPEDADGNRKKVTH